MLKFKQFILERRRATPQIKAWLGTRAKPYEYWMSRQFTLPFPLSKPMLDRMQNVAKESEGFHITDLDGVSTLFDLQNSAKSLSVTTKIKDVRSGILMLEGVETAGGILVEVKGDALFQGDFDIFSSPDSQGRRWIDLHQFAREFMRRTGDGNFLHNWDVIWRRTIIDHASKFIKSNSSELIDVYLAFAPEKGFSYPDYLSHASKNLDHAKLFWVGGQGFIVKGFDPDESLKEKGIVDKIETVHGSNHQLAKKAKMALFRMTKELFDMAEKYFTDNILDFFILGTEDKTYDYNEHIMDNFEIQNVYYDGEMYTPSEIGAEIGRHMSSEEIEANNWSKEDFNKYFKKWT